MKVATDGQGCMDILKEHMMPLTSDEPEEGRVRNGIIGTQIDVGRLVEEQVFPAQIVFLTIGMYFSIHPVRRQNEMALKNGLGCTPVPENTTILNDKRIEARMLFNFILPLLQQRGWYNDHIH